MATNNRGRVGLIGSNSKVSKYRNAAIKAAELAGRKKELLWVLQTCNSWQSIVNVCKQRNLDVKF
ncbi:MAG TPA: hypothetical protein VFV31_03750 [Chitinophagaceae bacterium]|nr:hypothetical protein [Chitinophagaceae bacterium]